MPVQLALYIGRWETIAILAVVLVLLGWRNTGSNFEMLFPGCGKELHDIVIFGLIALVAVGITTTLIEIQN